jgi:large subunit ribosomal protein L20
MALKRRRNILAQVKGYRNARSTKERQAREAIYHAGNHAFAGRRDKKGDFRRIWNVRINAAVRPLGLSYSVFINKLKTANIDLNRKMLSSIAAERPEVFAQIFAKANN